MPDLSIIIVSWNVSDLLRACLKSLTTDDRPSTIVGPLSIVHGPWSAEIIVVDNASSDGSAEMVADEFPRVRLIANSENRGFTGGNNQGLALAEGRHILFLNPDTEVVGDALATMLTYMDAHPAVGALGPQLRYGDGSLQSSRRRFPTFATALFESTPLAWHWPDNPWARRYRMEERGPLEVSTDAASQHGVKTSPPTPPLRREGSDLVPPSLRGKGVRGLGGRFSGQLPGAEEVDWLVGAALMVRRKALEQIGGFDEGYFMYSEELDWCHRAKKAGWQIAYLPAAQIIHYEGRSSEQASTARHIRFQTSKVRYFRKFHGAFQAEVLRVFILASFAVEWAVEATKWLLGSKRSLRRQRLAAYGQLLRSGIVDHRP